MTTQNERIKQTETKIIAALIKIGQKKPLTQITVSDLTRISGISRGTFYLHYLDKEDLINQLEGKLIVSITDIIKNNIKNTMNYDMFVKGKTYPLIVKIVALVAENHNLLQLLFSNNGDLTFQTKINDILRKSILQELTKTKGNSSFAPEFPLDYALSLIVNTIMTIIITWLNADDQLSQTDISHLIMHALFTSPYEMLAIKTNTK